MDEYLRSTPFMDFLEPAVSAFSIEKAGRSDNLTAQAVSLYYAVRDEIYYDPYSIHLSIGGLCGSNTLKKGYGWCVSKAILLAACCRFRGIPTRLGFADVKNHLSTERLRQTMKTDTFFWHGYTDIFLEGEWRKATPAFNIELCEKFSLKPLEFDGKSDSIYHPFDQKGNLHMEYVHHRGVYADVPLDEITQTFRKEYPGVDDALAAADFDQDVLQETDDRLKI